MEPAVKLPESERQVADGSHAADLRERVQALRDKGIDRFDPARFQVIVAMLNRCSRFPDPVVRRVEDKANQLLEAYLAANTQAPDSAIAIGDRLKRDNRNDPLKTLIRDLSCDHDGEQQSEMSLDDHLNLQEREIFESLSGESSRSTQYSAAMDLGQTELRSLKRLSDSLLALNAEKLLAQVAREGRCNLGPLNAQGLIIRTVTKMQQLSPEYAAQIVRYLETVLWLEELGKRG